MKEIVIYTTDWCPYCARAKQLLRHKNLPYQEIDVTDNNALYDAMVERAQGRDTVPQIFIDDLPIGGCDELHALEEEGRLDLLLAG